ncbi:hypothetical protein [Bifidobacterium longum]|uniref:hypothetical protein n=1 Tax=Bifidobacterium longum TaxID=216816 RepID=UPI00345E77BC
MVVEPRKRPKSSLRRFEAALPNELWQSDFTHWPLHAALGVLIVSWLDDHSRRILYIHAFEHVNNPVIEDTFHTASPHPRSPTTAPNTPTVSSAPTPTTSNARSPRRGCGSNTAIPGTRRPRERSNATTAPSRNGWANSPRPQAWTI